MEKLWGAGVSWEREGRRLWGGHLRVELLDALDAAEAVAVVGAVQAQIGLLGLVREVVVVQHELEVRRAQQRALDEDRLAAVEVARREGAQAAQRRRLDPEGLLGFGRGGGSGGGGAAACGRGRRRDGPHGGLLLLVRAGVQGEDPVVGSAGRRGVGDLAEVLVFFGPVDLGGRLGERGLLLAEVLTVGAAAAAAGDILAVVICVDVEACKTVGQG